MSELVKGTLMLLITMFLVYVIEILARYYAASSTFMERYRTIITLIMLMQILYIILPTERVSLID